MPIKFQAAAHAADPAASLPSVKFLEKHIQGAPLLNATRLNSVTLHASSFVNKAASMGEFMQNLPHVAPPAHSTAGEGLVAKLRKLVNLEETKMTPEAHDEFFKKYPEQHPHHPNKVAINNGLDLISKAVDIALIWAGLGGAAAGATAFLKAKQLRKLREGIGLISPIRNGTVFDNAVTEKTIQEQLFRVRDSIAEGSGRLQNIKSQLQQLNVHIYGSAPRAKKPLLEQQANLQKESIQITKDLQQTTENTVAAANKRYELIGSHLRVSDDLVVKPLPDGVIKARTQLLLETHHPQTVSAARNGSVADQQELRVLQHTVGLTPLNVRQKQEQIQAALKHLEEASPEPNHILEIGAAKTALQRLKAYSDDLDVSLAVSTFN